MVCRPKMNMDRLVAEIGETRTFLASRAQHSDGSRGAAALARRLAEGMASQIRQARTFGSSEAARLLDALSDDPYGFEGTAVVVVAVDNRLNTEGTNGRRASATQKLLHVYNYLTQEDWRKLRDPKLSLHAKMHVVNSRLVRCGCVHSHEQTVKFAVGLLMLTHFVQLPAHQEIYKHVLDYKAVCASSEGVVYPYEHILVYPNFPSELPERMRNHAYDIDAPPISVTIEGLHSICCQHIPLRKNSKLLASRAANDATEAVTWSSLREFMRGGAPADRLTIFDHGKGNCSVSAGLAALEWQPPGDSCGNSQLQRSRSFEEQAVADIQRSRSTSPLPAALASKLARDTAADERQTPALPRSDQGGSKDVVLLGASDAAREQSIVPLEAKAPGAKMGEDLGVDAYADAARAAMLLRDGKTKGAKKGKATAKAKSKAKAKAHAKSDPESLKAPKLEKGPSGAGEAKAKTKAKAKATAKAHPKAKSVAASAVATPKSKAKRAHETATPSKVPRLAPDGSAPPPQDYKAGRIYVSATKKGYRVIRKYPDFASERFVRWSGATPTKAEWEAALAAIDGYKKSKS